MRLSPEETARFYHIWFELLHFVNEQRHLVPDLPARPSDASVAPADAAVVRDALWADDPLRERFVAENPAHLSPDDLALVASWRHRVAGQFFIHRYLKKYAIFLSESTESAPARAYGVLGLIDSFDEMLGPYLPIYVRTVLVPFEGRITYDGLLTSYNILFGAGIRRSLRMAYRDAQEREGIITSLPLSGSDDHENAASRVRAQDAKVLAAFRRDLVRRGLSAARSVEHVAEIDTFARTYLLAQRLPRGLLELRRADLKEYLGAQDGANRVSFRRFVRFLADTERLDYDEAADLWEYLKHA